MRIELVSFYQNKDRVVLMCSACNGEGTMRAETIPCFYCKGKGYFKKIPPETKKL